ncbi:hypothetical protein DPMN_054809 [Dreissena polymorpha]|uniref:Uncharacterized protein n=1 Tax=Dreissena polymorpha TaxID=45954 RepID=A0A9D4HQ38_DREPO|nr:hypothetical protein DPMN_054809 [Dreissena polymorpha]
MRSCQTECWPVFRRLQGDTLQRVPEDAHVRDGAAPIRGSRGLHPERGHGGSGPLPAAERHHGDQDV